MNLSTQKHNYNVQLSWIWQTTHAPWKYTLVANNELVSDVLGLKQFGAAKLTPITERKQVCEQALSLSRSINYEQLIRCIWNLQHSPMP